jgi:DNA primase catalytic core
MPHVPPELKERLKREISVERLAEARGVKLRRSGKELLGLCPFHHDTDPSLRIDPAKNLWHCLGACNKGGDVISWVMHAEGVSFNHAVELLKRDHLPAAAASAGPPPKKTTVLKLPPLIEPTADDPRLLETIVSYYQRRFQETPAAQQYLAGRGLQSAEMVEQFRIGLADRSLAYHIPHSRSVTGEQQRERLKQIGILRQETGHEHFNGCVVIPVLNLKGEMVQMYGRKIKREFNQAPRHLYLPGPHRGVWNEEVLIASKEIILCEALIDALTFWCAGFRHVTSIYGVNGFTDDHRAAFQKHGTKKIYLAYDRDEAGERAAQAHGEELMSMGMECFRVHFPKGMDANEYARLTQPAVKALGMMLTCAAWLGKGKRRQVDVDVIEPTPAVEKPERPIEPTAEADEHAATVPEEIPLVPPAAAKEKILAESFQPVLSLAADPEPEEQPQPSATVSGLDIPAERQGEEITITQEARAYRIRGLEKNTSAAVMRVNVFVSGKNLRGEFVYHGDTFDMNLSRQRAVFIKQAAHELGVKEEVIHREVGQVWLKLEELQREQIKKTLNGDAPAEEELMTEEERAQAMELLRDPRLLDRIVRDFERCGMVGEETNKLVGYLAAVSRMLESPLAVLVQSTSAAGKSALMEAVLAFIPEQQRVEYSAMTGQALFYMGETDLKNKVLAIAEEEGVQRAAYALKLLQSEGKLTIASTGKDPTSGRLITHQYRVEGPVMIFLTTTAIDLDEELMNRCLVLTVNEDRDQTKAIHEKQREAQTLEGLLRRQERIEILNLHRNAHRLLKPLMVVNPYAPELTFPYSVTRTRRDHVKYLTLIRAVALLHQHQRPSKTVVHHGQRVEYIEATWNDIEIATKLAREILGRSLDELQPQTRNLLLLLDEMAGQACEAQQIERADYRFSRRDVREFTKWSDSQLKRHLHRLEELEYLIVHRGGRGQSMVYELFFESQGTNRQPFLPGLIDPDAGKNHSYDTKKSGLEGEKSGPSLAQVRGVSGGGAGEERAVTIGLRAGFYENLEKTTTREPGRKSEVVAAAPRLNGRARAVVEAK